VTISYLHKLCRIDKCSKITACVLPYFRLLDMTLIDRFSVIIMSLELRVLSIARYCFLLVLSCELLL